MVVAAILCGIGTAVATGATAVGTIVVRNGGQKKRFEKYLADGKKNPALTDEEAEAEFVNDDNGKSSIIAIAASAGVAAVCGATAALIGSALGGDCDCESDDDEEVEE